MSEAHDLKCAQVRRQEEKTRVNKEKGRERFQLRRGCQPFVIGTKIRLKRIPGRDSLADKTAVCIMQNLNVIGTRMQIMSQALSTKTFRVTLPRRGRGISTRMIARPENMNLKSMNSLLNS